MPNVRNNQIDIKITATTNTPTAPTSWKAPPPSIPPQKAPKNWLVEYTPIAEPFSPTGQNLAIKLGSEASK